MKKQLLAFILSFGVLSGFGQLVSLTDPINVLYGSVANSGEILEPHWDVTNISGTTVDLGCRRVIVQQVTGATHQFCWGEICSAWGTNNLTSGEIVTLPDGGSTNTFYAKYQHSGNAGQSIVRFCWFDSNDFTNEFCYDVNFCVDAECIVGVEENTPSARMEMITPNPVQGMGFISYHFSSAPQSGKMTIYNTLGAAVKQVDLSAKNGTLIIHSDEFENGIYFCTIEEAGHVFQTQRLVINK